MFTDNFMFTNNLCPISMFVYCWLFGSCLSRSNVIYMVLHFQGDLPKLWCTKEGLKWKEGLVSFFGKGLTLRQNFKRKFKLAIPPLLYHMSPVNTKHYHVALRSYWVTHPAQSCSPESFNVTYFSSSIFKYPFPQWKVSCLRVGECASFTSPY